MMDVDNSLVTLYISVAKTWRFRTGIDSIDSIERHYFIYFVSTFHEASLFSYYFHGYGTSKLKSSSQIVPEKEFFHRHHFGKFI